MSGKTALLCIDLINDIVDDRGKLAGKGYASFNRDRDVLGKIATVQRRCRDLGVPVIHIRVGFSPTYVEQPKGSPLFGRAAEFGALKLGAFGTAFCDAVAPAENEITIIKHRVSAFYGTDLDVILRAIGTDHLIVCGVATDLAVEAAARDAHDRDFRVTVLTDCCIAAGGDDHENALRTLRKLGSVMNSAEVEF